MVRDPLRQRAGKSQRQINGPTAAENSMSFGWKKENGWVPRPDRRIAEKREFGPLQNFRAENKRRGTFSGLGMMRSGWQAGD